MSGGVISYGDPLCVDVLITREAPTCHLSGLLDIAAAADPSLAPGVVNRYRDETNDGVLAAAVRVFEIGRAEALGLRRERLR
jgi:hypothetical protein